MDATVWPSQEIHYNLDHKSTPRQDHTQINHDIHNHKDMETSLPLLLFAAIHKNDSMIEKGKICCRICT